jgi:preprotein translocase subunit SecG
LDIIKTLIWLCNLVSALTVIVLVLLQHGKGADMGAAFGGSNSGSLFGASGSSNFMSRSTAVAAAIFFASSLALVYISAHQQQDLGVVSGVKPTAVQHSAQPVESQKAAPAKPENKIPD